MLAHCINCHGKKTAKDPNLRCLYCTQVCTRDLKCNICSPLSPSSFMRYRQVSHECIGQHSLQQTRRMSDSQDSSNSPRSSRISPLLLVGLYQAFRGWSTFLCTWALGTIVSSTPVSTFQAQQLLTTARVDG